MAYKLRFVQSFNKSNADAFLRLEQAFIELEKRDSSMACGRRYIPIMGKEPTNSMIWEAEFETMEAALKNLKAIESSSDHDELLNQQIGYMRDAYIELFKEL